ncbi:concanavalin A-like lectin/glucanase domain-containing protein [Chaetomium sp. MPI-SDFR-AT-0129]|uniref:Concanavalin A-like lectin/glucanase domain-containing protein n=1 Tax=Dichotomopilus funicola TaxID=1934379 RepID=A0AAN6V7K8_9PEZI|nr:concanavalin A-like lectin/glucanase domain-containing protein [Chaetomium sp. MPI-SDFR-AT-0129]KAK4146260.1 concanavalin A-like lectin/glucanase domain-containing protein [Dichotomopilus funicola]
MRFPTSYALLAAGLAQAQQYLVNDISFGTGARISPEGSQSIPNFALQGRPLVPELLSDRVILTPVAPGNQRGAVWADKTLQNQNWVTDVEFRASGPERGGGNFNIWLVRDGPSSVGSDSVYSAGRFEGLGLVVDQHSGSGGMLRGFLNDGTTDFRNHHNVDSLAFGQCSFTYRNLGRPTQIKLRHTEKEFSVEVAGRSCFKTDQVRLPSGYNFGLTAASADSPDSFEVFKLAVLTEDNNQQQQAQRKTRPAHLDQQNQDQDQDQKQFKKPRMVFGRSGQTVAEDPYDNVIPDEEAEDIVSSKAQFADLHNRLQSVNHHLSTIFRSIGKNANTDEARHAELSSMIDDLKGLMGRLEKVDVLEQRIRDLTSEMRSTRQEMAGRLRDSEASIREHVTDRNEVVRSHAHSTHTRLIWIVVGSQVVVLGAYVYYKRRKTTPKKYL